MLDTGVLRREEGKDKVHRLSINRVEFQRLFQPDEHAKHTIQAMKPGMGQGNASAHSGRTKALPVLERRSITGIELMP